MARIVLFLCLALLARGRSFVLQAAKRHREEASIFRPSDFLTWSGTPRNVSEEPMQQHGVSGHKEPRHVVQHSALLNNAGLWWMMVAVIFCMGAMVVKMEINPAIAAPKEEAELVPDKDHWSAWIMSLGLSVVGLNISMLVWGISQEQLMTTKYGDDSHAAPSALALVFLNRACALAVSALILKLQGRHLFFPGALYSFMPASTNLFSSWAQYQSLQYISFPLQTTVKSAKLLPVLLISSLRGKKNTIFDYAECAVVVIGLAVFGIETLSGGDSTHKTVMIGILFLVALLFVDSVTPHFQDSLFSKNPSMSSIQMSFSMAVFSCLASLLITLCDGSLFATITFFNRQPQTVVHAIVLCMSSTITQFLINYTIKNFGPVVFVLIATTRQMISVCVSSALFGHEISALAWIAAVLVFGCVIARSIRKSSEGTGGGKDGATADGQRDTAREEHGRRPSLTREACHFGVSLVDSLLRQSRTKQFVACAFGINVPLALYGLAQEFFAIHTFDGEYFRYPLFLIAANRTACAAFALVVLKAQGLSLVNRDLWLTIFPAGVNLAAAWCQYEALAFLRYPAMVLMKTIKALPVMICGRLLGNRSYGRMDYAEAVLITSMAVLFVALFLSDKASISVGNGVAPGIFLMIAYIIADSFTSNLQDHIYQKKKLDPAQMMLAMDIVSASVAWVVVLASGQLGPALHFLGRGSAPWLPLVVLMFADSAGGYACTVTVRLFGPAVFTLLLMTHQFISVFISVGLFHHYVQPLACVCLAVVLFLTFTSSLRRVYSMASETEQHTHIEKTGTGSKGKSDVAKMDTALPTRPECGTAAATPPPPSPPPQTLQPTAPRAARQPGARGQPRQTHTSSIRGPGGAALTQ